MTLYLEYHVNLSEGQKANLAKAIKTGSEITLGLKNSQLKGSDKLMLTKTQVNKIRKAMDSGTGVDIKISKTQIRKSVIQGGALWSSLITFGAKALPYVTKAASKALPALATGAVSALGSLGVDKIFGKGVQTGGFLIPQNKIDQLIKHKGWLTEAQKKQILSALHTGGQLVIRPTKTQRGGFLGSLLASIGIPLALEMGSKRFGKGLSVPKKAVGHELSTPTTGHGLAVGPKSGLMVPYQPPPFYGQWGRGGKKKKRLWNSIRPKQPIQQYSPTGSNSVSKPIWKDVPLSNFDLLKWIDYLKIPNI